MEQVGHMGHRPIEVLVVEDYPPDARLTREAFRDAGVVNEVHVVKDGVEAMDFLRRENQYADAPRPDFVVLDLDLPRKDGREVLHDMKADENLRTIPVVVVTSSRKREDLMTAYSEQVSCFITKPLDGEQYFTALRSLKELWFKAATLP
jgi:CheY-like chemotaxis protein